ncbi:MAG: heme exporter protein CcmD [Gammaproteobacteria bacterium]|nr:heme exporter protein CcmD [Gammaproteobacteria bacterium]MCP5406355.1 heme exporter protein CcmD [Chromatiaceae bacterium]MCP5408023.1 heme exporter protein CcmD [Chromatiaceae bacterium]MCP5442922.1 heme exporter protein CcmD [Chromatiaceae bacterium]
MSAAEFFHMGGYGLYVWGSFGVSALLMVVEPILLRNRRKATLQRISRIVRLNTEVRDES